MAQLQKHRRRMIAEFMAEESPSWVQGFAGPFQDNSKELISEELFEHDYKTLLLKWTGEYTDGGLGNIVVPAVKFVNMKPVIKHMVLIGDLEDTARMASIQVSKDPLAFPFPSRNVVNTPDIHAWKDLRGGIADAFLPLTNLPKTTAVVDQYAQIWCKRLEKERTGIIDIKEELLHTALCIFIHALLGIDDPFGSHFSQVLLKDSERVRNIFNLELKHLDRNSMIERATFGRAFVESLFDKAKSKPTQTPLMQGLLAIEDDEVRIENMMALLVAGHDTTAYTMQFLLFELARNPAYQARARDECVRFYEEIEQSGRSLEYDDLNKLVFLRQCINESLRLWNVAMIVFSRVTVTDEIISGVKNEKVLVPKGTSFNFWYFGQHHSEELWGEDALIFNPDRQFRNHEIQQGEASNHEPKFVAFTPSTERFHPFSMPRRDCLGKNFALIEMRILISRLLQSFHVDLAEPTLSESKSLQIGSGEIYLKWAKESGGMVQPEKLMLKLTPLSKANL